jgi:RNA polymerase primary sigma factor
MNASVNTDRFDALGNFGSADTMLLGPARERHLLEQLADCRRTLAADLARIPGVGSPEKVDDPRSLSRFLARAYRENKAGDGALAPAFERYFRMRTELALANVRLVSHVARQFRSRGIANSDLLQEGFCGLLEAIDRFDIAHKTKLATYATWWIRQAIQAAVATGSYPVRLAPRHLRQLALSQEECGSNANRNRLGKEPSATALQRIQAATRRGITLAEPRNALLRALETTDRDISDDIDLEEAVGKWLISLRPRERQVLSYRFGLGGSPRLSLSQIGKLLDVSKERVRQIQNSALAMLRTNVSRDCCVSNN